LFTISDSIHIHAPIERCFLLSTSLELVEQVLEMRPVEGDSRKTAGLMVEGDRIEWRGWAFGLPQVHENLITRYERPCFFQDTMARGRFRQFQHDHLFTEIDGHTLLVDKLRFSLPLGRPGRMAARYLVVPHMTELLRRRMSLLKRVAESHEWRRYLGGNAGINAAINAGINPEINPGGSVGSGVCSKSFSVQGV
jgi:ligand-binding SRPBCC domain-containing protein